MRLFLPQEKLCLTVVVVCNVHHYTGLSSYFYKWIPGISSWFLKLKIWTPFLVTIYFVLITILHNHMLINHMGHKGIFKSLITVNKQNLILRRT